MLGHDVLNGVLTAIQPIVYLFIFRAISVLQSLKDVGFISGRHRIDIFVFEPLSKIFICWESCLFFLVTKNKTQFFNETIVGTIESLDIITERKEYLALRVGRQIADKTTKKIGFDNTSDFTHII